MKEINLPRSLSGHRRFRPGCAIRLRSCDELHRLQDLSMGRLQSGGGQRSAPRWRYQARFDAQFAGKGLRRADNGGDLLLGYRTAMSQEKQFDSFGWGPGLWGGWGDRRITTSTIDVGKLVIGLFDPANKQLVWRGSASKTSTFPRTPTRLSHARKGDGQAVQELSASPG